jgi:hypothetical protein
LSSTQAANCGMIANNNRINNNHIECSENVTKSSIISNASLPSSQQWQQHYNYNNNINNNHHHPQHNHILKKQGVSGESCDANFTGHSSDILIRKYEKDFKWVLYHKFIEIKFIINDNIMQMQAADKGCNFR